MDHVDSDTVPVVPNVPTMESVPPVESAPPVDSVQSSVILPTVDMEHFLDAMRALPSSVLQGLLSIANATKKWFFSRCLLYFSGISFLSVC